MLLSVKKYYMSKSFKHFLHLFTVHYSTLVNKIYLELSGFPICKLTGIPSLVVSTTNDPFE